MLLTSPDTDAVLFVLVAKQRKLSFSLSGLSDCE